MTINKEQISIIVPIYNAEPYLKKCIESIIQQTYYNIQIILIDDGSTDNSKEICNYFAKKDKRIELYCNENKGSVAARKLGIKIAKGKYIGFVDADDYIERDMFLELWKGLTECNADIVHFGHIEEIEGIQKIVCNFEEEVININTITKKIQFLNKYILNDGKGDYISFSLWSKLFKTELIKKHFCNLSDEQQYGEDLLCLLKCILEGCQISLIKKEKYHYRIRKSTLSHLNDNDYMINEISLWHHIIQILKEYNYLEITQKIMWNYLKPRMFSIIISHNNIHIPKYYFKNISQLIGKRIVIYGAGKVGQDYYVQIRQYQNCTISAWIDSNWYKYNFEYAQVVDIGNITSISFDVIVIAVYDRETGREIKNLLLSNNVSIKKIIWEKPSMYY